MRVRWSKMANFAFSAHYSFQTVTYSATTIILQYIVAPGVFNDIEIDDLEWLFCVKICLRFGI